MGSHKTATVGCCICCLILKLALIRSVDFFRCVLRRKNAGKGFEVSERGGREEVRGGFPSWHGRERRPCCSLGWRSAGCAGLTVRKEDGVGLA